MRTAATAMAVAAALSGLAIGHAPTQAQEPVSGAAPYLTPDHWTLHVLRRLDGLGLLERYDPALPGVTRVDAATMLDRALAEARERGDPELISLLEGLLGRYAAEYPVAVERSRGSDHSGAGAFSVGAGVHATDGEMLTTVGTPPLEDQPWEPEQPAELADGATDPVGRFLGSAYVGRHLASQAGLEWAADELRSWRVQLVGEAGPVTGWAGTRRLRIGPGDGGVMATGAVEVAGAGLAVAPFRLPWLLEHVGSIQVATSLGQLEYAAPHQNPWLWLLRVTVQPHSRVMLGVNRGAMAVGVEGNFGHRLRQIAYIAIGKHMDDPNDNWRDNQMASVDLRYRPPLGALPVTLYLEWGLDDSAGSWKDVPGIVGGAYLAAVPGAPWLAAGIERTYFAERCCGNIWWYRHSGFTGGWTDQRQPLGHAVGGHGSEWAARIDAMVLGGRGLLKTRVFHRERGDENLFAPTFQGSSTGGSAEFSGTVWRGVELGAGVRYEGGASDWSTAAGQLQLTFLF